jgi:uncharacterized membrane protein
VSWHLVLASVLLALAIFGGQYVGIAVYRYEKSRRLANVDRESCGYLRREVEALKGAGSTAVLVALLVALLLACNFLVLSGMILWALRT